VIYGENFGYEDLSNLGEVKKKKWQEKVTISILRKEGWTYQMIEQYLGAPDETKPNPYSNKSPPMKLYLKERVTEACKKYNIKLKDSF